MTFRKIWNAKKSDYNTSEDEKKKSVNLLYPILQNCRSKIQYNKILFRRSKNIASKIKVLILNNVPMNENKDEEKWESIEAKSIDDDDGDSLDDINVT